MSVWISDEKLLIFASLISPSKKDFVWEEISNIRHSVSSPDETPRSSSKILRCASYFQLSSRCFIWWWNTTSHVWYITSKSTTTTHPLTIHYSMQELKNVTEIIKYGFNSALVVKRDWLAIKAVFTIIKKSSAFKWCSALGSWNKLVL